MMQNIDYDEDHYHHNCVIIIDNGANTSKWWVHDDFLHDDSVHDDGSDVDVYYDDDDDCVAGCIATLRAGVERKTENRIGSSAASARTCFDDDGDAGDDDDYHHNT